MGEFDTTIGYMLVSVLLNTFFGGIIASQFSSYYNSKFGDPPWIKLSVVALYLMNAGHIVSIALMAWSYCVANFNNPAIVSHTGWPLTLSSLMTAVLALINQTFQSHRIYRFTGNKWLSAFLGAGILADFSLGLAASIQATLLTNLDKIDELHVTVEGNLALQAALDIIISIILTVKFYKSKTRIHAVSFGQSKSKLRRTNKGLNMLMRAAIQSGTFTSLFAIGSLLAFRYAPGTYMNLIFAVPIGRIYTHTILDHLISRQHLRHILTTDGSTRNPTRGARPAVATTNRNVPQSSVVFTNLHTSDMMAGHESSGTGSGTGTDPEYSLQLRNDLDKDKDPEAQLQPEVDEIEMHSRSESFADLQQHSVGTETGTGRERTFAEP
ncbi:hypothetical protein FB45DRAFT_47633 [Roridomyces roridus]|uniref:DUF6534 domain-containing protein n=1 Tax=Roridomyces roridus TaxID=1738132 RepID=A0AAD7FKA8_9AGAR|nr:hypothetical protein FB45DRAFT_47633 [Roridomyces roridus]